VRLFRPLSPARSPLSGLQCCCSWSHGDSLLHRLLVYSAWLPQARWDGSTCHKHSRWLANMSSGLRAAWHFQTWLGDLLPCDLAAYDRVWDSLHGDPVLETIAALIKEPTPVLEFSSMVRGLPFDYNHLDLGQHVLIPLLRYMDGRLEKEEHQSLNGQGPAT
jgi:hypothetical protein